MALIQLAHITKRYFIGTANELTVLDDVNLTIEKGSFTAIVGPSGSGGSSTGPPKGATSSTGCPSTRCPTPSFR